jgi:hypothetical protein
VIRWKISQQPTFFVKAQLLPAFFLAGTTLRATPAQLLPGGAAVRAQLPQNFYPASSATLGRLLPRKLDRHPTVATSWRCCHGPTGSHHRAPPPAARPQRLRVSWPPCRHAAPPADPRRAVLTVASTRCLAAASAHCPGRLLLLSSGVPRLFLLR